MEGKIRWNTKKSEPFEASTFEFVINIFQVNNRILLLLGIQGFHVELRNHTLTKP